MKSFLLNRLVFITLALAACISCSETAAKIQAAPQAASDANAAVAEISAGRETDDKRPAFTQETVLKLNPIVARSKAALDRFDQLLPEITAAREAKDKAKIAAHAPELAKLKSETEVANTAFQAEKKALLSRGEYYNEVVLGAMEQFVAEAPTEIAEALKQPAQ